MSKKMMKRSLALGALMAFVITGQAWAADNVLNGEMYTSTDRVDWDGSDIVNTQLGGNELGEKVGQNRSYGLAVTSGSLTLADGDKLTITNNMANTNRNYGIVLKNNAELTINREVEINVSHSNADDIQVRGIRNSGNSAVLTFNKDVVVNATLTNSKTRDDESYVTGIDTWYGETIFNGNVTVTTIGDNLVNSWANAVQVGENGTIKFNGANTNLNVESSGFTAQAVSMTGTNVGSVIYFNSDNTTIDVVSSHGATGFGSTAPKDNHNVYFGTEGKEDAIVNINILVDTNSDRIGDLGKSNAVGVMSNLNVANTIKEFNINVKGSGVTNANGTAGLLVKSDSNPNVEINAQTLNVTVVGSETIGDNRDNTHGIKVVGSESNFVATGATTVTVTDPVGKAYGVYGEDGAVVNLANVDVVATSVKGDAYSIYATNMYTNDDKEEVSGAASKITVGGDDKKVTLTGDIYNKDSNVDINFGAEGSKFDGKVIAAGNANTTLNFANGATWNLTGDSFVNTLAGNGGNLVKAEGVGDVTVTVYNHNENQKDENDNDNDNVIEGFSGVAFANNNLKITDVNLVVDTWETSIYNNNIKIDSNSDVTIKTGKDDGICAYGNVEIKAQNVTIEAFDNGIKAGPDGENNDGKAQIAEGNVDIIATNAVNISSKVNKELRPDDSTGEGYAITNVSTSEKVINVTGETVTLSSDNKTAVKAGHIDGQNIFNGTINVTGTKTINIDGYAVVDNDGDEEKEYEDSVVSAQGKGVLNLSAPTITITDNAEAGGNSIGAYDGGVVTVTADKVKLDSKIFANGEGSKISFINVGDDNNLELTATGEKIHGINAESGATVELGKAKLDITAVGDGDTRACAIDASRNGLVKSNKRVTTEVKGGAWAAGVEATHEGSVTLKKATLNVTDNGSGEAYGINVARQGTAIVNNELIATITGGEWASGVEAYNGSNINVGDGTSNVNLTVTASSQTISDPNEAEWGVRAHGIFAAGQPQDVVGKDDEDDEVAYGGSNINIDATDLTINATAEHGQAYGIYAQDEGNVKANGAVNATVSGYSAYGVEAIAGSTVEIGSSDKDVTFTITSNGVDKNSVSGEYPEAQAITAEGGSQVTVNANVLQVTTFADSGIAGSIQARDKDSVITVNATNVNLEGDMFAGEGAKVAVTTDKFAVIGNVGSEGVIDIVTGDVAYGSDTKFYTEKNGVINFAGGNVTGILNIAKGNVSLTGAAFEAQDLNKAITGEGKLVVDSSGVLKTTADQVFTVAGKDTVTTDKEVLDKNSITDVASKKVTFKAGSVSLSDDYSYDYLTSITDVIGTHKYNGIDNSATKIVMTGDLVSKVNPDDVVPEEDKKLDVDDASNLGTNVELDKVTVEAENNLLIGALVPEDGSVKVSAGDGSHIAVEDSVKNGFSANQLDLGEESTGAVITGGQEIVLGGSQNDTSDGTSHEIVTVGGKTKEDLVIVVGTENKIGDAKDNNGKLKIGNSAAKGNDKFQLTGKAVVNKDSELHAKGETTITKGVELKDGGKVHVDKDAHLKANIKAKGNGNLITGKVTGNLEVEEGHPSTMIHLGNENVAGKLHAETANLNGATLFLDPAKANSIRDASVFTLENAGNLNGHIIVGQNSVAAFGVSNEDEVEKVFAKTGLTFGSNGEVDAVVYVASKTDITSGSIIADGSRTSSNPGTPANLGSINLDEKSLLMVEAEDVNGNTAAIIGANAVTIDSNAKVYIDDAKKGEKYQIIEDNDDKLNAANIITNNNLLTFTKDSVSGKFEAEVEKVSNVYGNDVIIGDVIDEALDKDEASADIFNSAADGKNNNNTDKQIDALNSIGAMNEVAGVTHTTYAVSNILTDAVADHMSLANGKEHDKDIWAHYVHTKENVDGLKRAGAYDAQYNGIVVGTDLYNEGKATVGAALTYVDGNINGSSVAARTENDAKYYGASVYGSIQNDDTAVIADVSYLHGEHDITQRNSGKVITGEPETDAFSVGVRVEKEAKAGIGKLVPYAGLRYMHLGTGNYTNSIGLAYDADDAELFLLPVGLKYSADIKNTNGWTMRPVVEFGYVWAFGDTDADQTVSLNGASNGFGYDVTDSGSYVGRFMLEAEKANISYALGYEYQKGDNVEADKWMVNVNWKF